MLQEIIHYVICKVLAVIVMKTLNLFTSEFSLNLTSSEHG